MKLRSKETYWLLKNGLIRSYPSLRKNIECDILIVGGGITGSLMAFQFSSEGYHTVLIDKRDVSLGSTSATTSLLQYELDEPLYSLIDKVGENAAVETYTEGVKAIQRLSRLVKAMDIPCGFARKNSLYIATSQKDATWLATEFECRKKFGFDVQWLTPEQLGETYGGTGAGGILSAVGASMDAYSLSHSLLDHCVVNYNLEIFDHTALMDVVYREDDNKIYTDDNATIICKKIIYATGYETQLFMKDKIVDLVSTYAFISEPLENLSDSLSDIISWDTDKPYLYMRTTPDHRVLVGGEDEMFKNPERRDRIIESKGEDLLRKFNKLFPGIELIPDFCWAGTFGITKDSLPYIGAHPDYPNSYFILGFGGNGITFSLMGMEIISDAIAGKHNRFLEYFKFKR